MMSESEINPLLEKTTFVIPKMDCAAEENLIRLKLNEISGIRHLEFELSKRELIVFHVGELTKIEEAIGELNLGGRKIETVNSERTEFDSGTSQRKLLWTVLGINFGFFLIEIVSGIVSNSMGLVADSLDMLADAFVYGISLLAVGAAINRKKQVARVAGYFQLGLASLGLIEVLRRFLGAERSPDFSTMIIVSILALIANGICLYLLQKSKSKEAHMQASMIFTSNDVIINLGVIIAGILVFSTGSLYPDLIVGIVVFLVVIRGAIRILKLGK